MIKSFFLLFILSCGQEVSVRNKLVFENEVEEVSDSIAKLELLMYKLPESRPINYFMDYQGNLFINNREIGSLYGAVNNPKVRTDEAFRNFTDDEIDQFFSLIAFLLKNHIDAAVMERSIGEFTYNYRSTPERRYDDTREIILIDSLSNNNLFDKTYQVLDSKIDLILVAPKDALIR